MGMRVVVVGGSTAGFICSLTARRFYKDAKITVVRREKKALVTCGIPYIFGTLLNIEKDLLPDKLLTDNDIELVIGEVKSIRRDEKAVILSSGQKINYDKLVLATGSVPAKPPIHGIDLENVFFAKKDPDYLQGLLVKLEGAKDVVVIGGGFVGVEFAEQFRKRGLDVTIVELLPHCLQLNLDDEFCIMAEEKLRELGVRVITGERVEEIVGRDGKVVGGEARRRGKAQGGHGARRSRRQTRDLARERSPTEDRRRRRSMGKRVHADVGCRRLRSWRLR
jgi:NADPH-dependent 2,4-dienoyl-CoA reductase/sulfur reductase-like enzyme